MKGNGQIWKGKETGEGEVIEKTLFYPHIETNEDGKQIQHEGYTQKMCVVCHHPFLVAKTQARNFDECGLNHKLDLGMRS